MNTSQHGIFRMKLIGDTLEVLFQGSFNKQIATSYASEIKSKINTLNGSPFKLLFDGTQFEGATPEAFDVSNQVNEWLI